MMTDREVENVKSGLNSTRSLRAIRSRVIFKAWEDPEYKTQLLTDPKTVLINAGFQIPANVTVKVLENNSDRLYLVIPNLH
jgi:hypothetical protein